MEPVPDPGGTEPGPSVGPRAIFGQASALSAASILAAVVALPVSLTAAKWIGPKDYGLAQLVLLLYFGATLVRSGSFDGGLREYVHRRALGEDAEGRRLRNVGISFDLVVSAVPGLLLPLLAFVADERLVQIGLLLAPISVLTSTASSFLSAVAMGEQRFSQVARINAARAVASAVAILGGIVLVGPIAVAIGPAVADTAVLLMLLWVLRDSGLALISWRGSLRPLVRVGFPIALMSIVYWAYRLTGSVSMAITGDARQLGLYAFALAPVTVASRAMAQVAGVLTPTVWSAMALDPAGARWRREGLRLTVVIGLVAALTANLGQATFAPAVDLLVPAFGSATTTFDVLAFNILFLALAFVPSIVLLSKEANRQVLSLGIGVGGLAVNVVANALVLHRDGGAVGVAVNDVWVQAAVVLTTFVVADRYLREGGGEARLRVYVQLMGVVAWAIVVGVVLHRHTTSSDGWSETLVSLATRGAVVLGAWVLPGWLILRRRVAA